MMIATWLPANQCWCVVFGDTLTDINRHFLFTTRDELVTELTSVGLTLHTDDTITL